MLRRVFERERNIYLIISNEMWTLATSSRTWNYYKEEHFNNTQYYLEITLVYKEGWSKRCKNYFNPFGNLFVQIVHCIPINIYLFSLLCHGQNGKRHHNFSTTQYHVQLFVRMLAYSFKVLPELVSDESDLRDVLVQELTNIFAAWISARARRPASIKM